MQFGRAGHAAGVRSEAEGCQQEEFIKETSVLLGK